MSRSLADVERDFCELKEREAMLHAERATMLERAERKAPHGWISQNDTPIGKRRHLEHWRRLRDAKAPGIKTIGKLRLIEKATLESLLDDAANAPRRRRAAASGVDLAARFGVASSPKKAATK